MFMSAVRTCRVFAKAITVLTLAGGAAGCSPLVAMEPASPDGPRISRLQLTPDRSTVGCPVELRFSFDAPREELVKAIAGWTLTYGRRGALGYLTLATDPQAFGGRPHGEFVTQLMPDRSGMYRYYVQVEDRAGHKSNVLTATLPVEGWWRSECPRDSWAHPSEASS